MSNTNSQADDARLEREHSADAPVAPEHTPAVHDSKRLTRMEQQRLLRKEKKLNQLRVAADPKVRRSFLDSVQNQWEQWQKEAAPGRQGESSADFVEEARAEGVKRLRKIKAAVKNALKAAEVQSGLCYSQVPQQLLQSPHLRLTQWSVLVDDSTLQLIQVYDQLQRSKVDRNKSATGDLAAVALYSGARYTGIRELVVPLAKRVTDKGVLRLISSVNNLEVLNLRGCQRLTDVSVRALLKRTPQLLELDLSACSKVGPAALVALGESCPKLKRLSLSRTALTQEWLLMRVATGCCQLEFIDLSYNENLENDGLKALSLRCKRLKRLNLKYCTNLSDVGLLAVCESCPDLESLDLSRKALEHKLTDVTLLSLAERCITLDKLILKGNEYISDVGISWLASGCKSITSLDLSQCFKIGDVGLRAISESMHSLAELNIHGLKQVTDTGIRHLGVGCKLLKSLNVSGIYLLTDGQNRNFGLTGLQYLLKECLRLQHLCLKGCFQIGGTVLRELSTGFDEVTEQQSLRCGQGMHSLNLAGLPKVNAKVLNYFLSGRAKDTLQELDLSNCVLVCDKTLKLLGVNCGELKSLKLNNCEKITSKGISLLFSKKVCRRIQVLEMRHCPEVKDLALLAIVEASLNPGLTLLDVSYCKDITEIGVAWLADKMPSLVCLNVRGCEGVSSQGMKALIGSWKFVSFRNTDTFLGIFPAEDCKQMRFIETYGEVWNAATKIQSCHRKKLAVRKMAARRERHLMHWTARKLQSYWRRKVASKLAVVKRLERDRQVEACIKVQKMFRCRKAREAAARARIEQERRRCEQSATLVQKIWRGKMARNLAEAARQAKRAELKRWNASALQVQRIWRGLEGRRKYQMARAAKLAQDAKEAEAALKIQTIIRGRHGRLEAFERRQRILRFEECKEQAAISIQCALRQRFARKEAGMIRQHLRDRELAATKLQCMWRKKTAQFSYHMMLQARRDFLLDQAARRVQAIWRGRQGKLSAFLLQAAKEQEHLRRSQAASRIQAIFRGKKDKLYAQMMLAAKNAKQNREAKLREWAATLVQAHYRGCVGRKRALLQKEAKMRRWKEMFDEEQDRPFYYNQDTGEVRWRKPQPLLDLLEAPVCNNCCIEYALFECGNCIEYFCQFCFESVHYGGRRKEHEFRPLYDMYGKRVDYGDGEWPSVWPSEIEQDDMIGWHRLQRQQQAERGEAVTAGLPEYMLQPDVDPERDISDDSDIEEEVVSHRDDSTPEATSLGFLEEQRQEDSTLWTKYWDEEHELEFYYNSETGESTYDKPDSYVDSEGEDYVIEEEDEEETSEEPAWIKKFEEATGRAFFYNLKSGIATYDRPAEYTTPREDTPQPRGDSLWIRLTETQEVEGTGGEVKEVEYYYNQQSGATSYERPPEYETPREDNWVKYYDEVNERDYYYNETSGVSQYLRPAGFETPRPEGYVEGLNGWVKYPDEAGAFVYENLNTNVVQYEYPEDFAIELKEGKSEEAWQKYYDEDAEAFYYYNHNTGESSYYPPEEYQEDEEEGQEDIEM